MKLRTLLILGRVSNLPTVWSNLLAGWLLSFRGFNGKLLLLLAGGSALYTGGMYLNDFFDAAFDAQHCPQRPIPSGKISRATVGRLAAVWFVLGLTCLVLLGLTAAIVALVLVAAILLYDYRHKDVTWAPLVMGLCRALLYLLAASAARGSDFIENAFLEWPIYILATALGLYVAGITYVARGESRPQKPVRWALVLVLAPVVVQVLIDLIFPSLTLLSWIPYALLLIGWLAWLLVPLWRGTSPSIGRVVAGMLAGIVLVDMLALARTPGAYAEPLLIVLFPLALLLQRIIPAT